MNGKRGLVQGIIEAGAEVVTGYPGSPITGVEEGLQGSGEIDHVEWSANEKQAVALAYGASLGGSRAVVLMKHVGVNVASDAIVGTAINGVNGGLLFLFGDDPGGEASQNEQDSRNYAHLFNIPIFEPSSPSQAVNMIKLGFELSEIFKLPVGIRYVKDFLHIEEKFAAPSLVEDIQLPEFSPDFPKEIPLPLNAPKKNRVLQDKIDGLRAYLDTLPFNECSDVRSPGTGTDEVETKVGLVSCGSILRKLNAFSLTEEIPSIHCRVGVVHPFLGDRLAHGLDDLEKVIVLEEGSPYIERELHRMISPGPNSVEVRGKLSGDLPRQGKLSAEDVRGACAKLEGEDPASAVDKRNFPPDKERAKWQQVEGCPVERVHGQLRKALDLVEEEVRVIGDTGCTGWGHVEPYRTVDNFLCMGTSAAVASGVAASGSEERAVAMMGDSSFFHSGIQSLLNAKYNGHELTFIIVDNGVTGETGGQVNPGSGVNALGKEVEGISVEGFVKASGVSDFKVLDLEKGDPIFKTVARFIAAKELNVLILKGKCPASCFQ